jgi:hypothetical protein
MDGHGGDDPLGISGGFLYQKSDSAFSAYGEMQLITDLGRLITSMIDDKQSRFRVTAAQPPGGKRSEVTRTQNPDAAGRKRIKEGGSSGFGHILLSFDESRLV